MSGSGIEEDAMRLLAAFHDLAGGKLNIPVPVGGADSDEIGAADRARIGKDTVKRDVALRYLLSQGYVQAEEAGSGYTLTHTGLERARE